MMIQLKPANMQQKIAKTVNDVLPNASEIPMLTNDEMLALIARMKDGDAEAAEKFKLHNQRFVASVAKQYQNQGLTMPELIYEGNIGLMKAAEKYNASHGYTFVAYAVWWIRESILQALAIKH